MQRRLTRSRTIDAPPPLTACKQVDVFIRNTQRRGTTPHTRVYARTLQQQCCFFAVTSVTPQKETRGKGETKTRERQVKKQTLLAVLSSVLGSLKNLIY